MKEQNSHTASYLASQDPFEMNVPASIFLASFNSNKLFSTSNAYWCCCCCTPCC